MQTPRRLLLMVVLVAGLLGLVVWGVTAFRDYNQQAEKEFWEKAGSGTLFRR